MSINRITFLDQFYPTGIFHINNPEFTNFYYSDWIEVIKFLNKLEEDTIYVVSFEFIFSWDTFNEDSPTLILSKPILVTKNSNSKIISKFLQDRIHLTCENFYLNNDLMEVLEGPGVLVKYKPINLF
jgi:hypothetical protein